MAQITTNDKMNLVQFLDFLSTCIFMSSVPPTVLKSGATHFHLGCFMSLSTVVRMVSNKILIELMKHSKKQELLKYVLLAASVLNAALFMTTTVTGILFNRILYVFVNNVGILSGEMINKDPKDRSIYEKAQVQMLAASLIAAATVGSFIDSQGGFYTLVIIATAIAGISVAIILQMEPEKDEKKKPLTVQTAVEVIPKTFTDIIKTIYSIHIDFSNWDAFLIKSMLITNAKIVYIFYVVMIIFVFRGNGATVCTTSAYQTIAISLSGLIFTKLNSNINQLGNPKEILEKSCITCVVCALVMGFSPSYSLYLFTFIPFVMSRTLIENYFPDVFKVEKNQKLGNDIETVAAITEIVFPIFIGLLFHLLRENAYRILAAAPILVIYYVTKQRAIYEKENKTNTDKQNSNKPVETNKDK